MFFLSTYLYFKNYLFEFFYVLSEYYGSSRIEDNREVNIEMVDEQNIYNVTEQPTILDKSVKTHKEICEMYVLECKRNKTLFLEFNDFINNLTLYSKCYGAKNITKLNVKYLESKYSLLEYNLNKNLENIYL